MAMPPPMIAFSPSTPTMAPGGGKGGRPDINAMFPTMPPPMIQTSPTLTPQSASGFNVNQAAASGLQDAMQGTRAGMNYAPQSISAAMYDPASAGSQGYNASTMGGQTVNAQNVAAGQMAGADLSQYTNPFETQVVQQSLDDLERSRLIAQNQADAAAGAAGSFGGSRHGVANAETNRAFADQAARTASGLRQAGFQNAQSMAGQDIAARMQAALANQGANLQANTSTAQFGQQANMQNQAAQNAAGQFGADASNRVNLTNQAAQNAAGQFNAGNMMLAQQNNQSAGLQGAQQRLNAANQMGNLGNQAFNTGQTIQQNQMQQGLMQQALQQALIDAARQQYAGFTGAPTASLGAPLAALGATPGQSTTTDTTNPSVWDYLATSGAVFASDQRLKTNVTPAGNIGNVNLYNWDWNDEGRRVSDPAQPTFGVMADELKATHPHLVKRAGDGYLRVDYAGLSRELMGAGA